MTSTPVTNAAAFIAPANMGAQTGQTGKDASPVQKGLSFSDTMMQQTNLTTLSTPASRTNDPQLSNLQAKPSGETKEPKQETKTEKNVSAEDNGKDVTKAEDPAETSETATEETETTKEVKETETLTEEEQSTPKVDVIPEEVLEIVSSAMIQEIAAVLNVPEETVTEAVEQLSMEPAELFTREGISKVVMEVTGNTDPAAMLTDETLYSQVQELVNASKEILENASEETGIPTEEIMKLITLIPKDTEKTEDTPVIFEAAKEEEILPDTVIREEKRPVVQLFDGRSQKTQVKNPVGEAAIVQTVRVEKDSAKEEMTGQESGGMLFGQNEQTFQVETESVPEVPVQTYVATTEEIMNQVMDYMRINLTSDANELSMQLNPESLGTIHVQIVERNGSISAQFHTTNEVVKEALETQMVILKQNFEEQGIKVDAIQVTVNDSDFERDLQQGFGQNNQEAGQNEQNAPKRVRRIVIGEDGSFSDDLEEEDRIQAELMTANGNSVDLQA